MPVDLPTGGSPSPAARFSVATGARASFFARGRRLAAGLVGSVVVAGLAIATQGCVDEDVAVVNDPFVGVSRRFVMPLVGGGYQGTQELAVTEGGGRFALQVTVMDYGDSLEVARAGETSEFLVGTEIVALPVAREARPVASRLYGMPNGPILTQWRVPFVLDGAQAARFASGPLRALKVPIGSQVHQVSLPDSKASKFQQNMALMSQPPPK